MILKIIMVFNVYIFSYYLYLAFVISTKKIYSALLAVK